MLTLSPDVQYEFVVVVFKVFCVFFFNLRERERERESGVRAKREERIPSRLCATTDEGLDPVNNEIVTVVKIKSRMLN